MDKKYYLKELATKFNMSEHTLRYYDEIAIINFDRDQNDYRFLPESKLNTLNLIVCLKKTGMSLKNVKKYLSLIEEGEKSFPERNSIITKQLVIVNNKIDELNEQKEFLEYKNNYYEENMKKR